MSSDGDDTSQRDAKVHSTSKRDVTIEMQHMDGDKGTKDDVDNLDMLNRDPNDLNPQLKTFYEDIIGEPEGAHSADCVWRNSYKCFYLGKDCCYSCLTFICAIPLAFCWGCHFACVTFNHIWTITPCLFMFNVNFSCCSRCYSTVIHCCFDPLYESASLIFSRIFFNHVKADQGFQGIDIERLNMMNRRGAPGRNSKRS